LPALPPLPPAPPLLVAPPPPLPPLPVVPPPPELPPLLLAESCLEPPLPELPPASNQASVFPLFVLSLLQPEIENVETAIVATIHLFIMTISQHLFAFLYRLRVLISPWNML
jgi:hypothetical protein